MSVGFTISSLDHQLKQKIVKDLHLKEQSPNYQHTKISNQKTIDFYTIVDNVLYVPYYYASQITGHNFPNKHLKYPPIERFDMIDGFNLRPYQNEAITLALEDYRKRGTCFFNVFCSYGKTVVSAWLSAYTSCKGLMTLITFPRTMIGKSWIGTFASITKAKVWVVGNGEYKPDVQVILCMDSKLKDLPTNIRCRVGHLIIDEADNYCTVDHVHGILGIQPQYITVLTATYERDDGFHVMLDLLSGPERIVSISTKPFFVLELRTNFRPNDIKTTSRGIQYGSLVSSLDKLDDRNLLICNMVLHNLMEKIMVLTMHVPHAQYMHNILNTILSPYGKKAALLCGNVSSYDDADVIVATISKAGRGFDEKEACNKWNGKRINMVILCTSTKKIEQIAGRVFRADIPVVVDIVDNHTNLKSHYRDRKKWYESRNGIIHSIDGVSTWNTIQPYLQDKYDQALKQGAQSIAVRMTSGQKPKSKPQKKEESSSSNMINDLLEDYGL